MVSGLLTPTHLVLVVAVALMVFGPKRLPEIGKSLGTGMRGFKDSLEGGRDAAHIAASDERSPEE